MLELMLCSLLTVLPDYLVRRFAQGKRWGKEITFFTMWYELRWGITSCVLLTVALITLIFFYHPSTTMASPFFRTRVSWAGMVFTEPPTRANTDWDTSRPGSGPFGAASTGASGVFSVLSVAAGSGAPPLHPARRAPAERAPNTHTPAATRRSINTLLGRLCRRFQAGRQDPTGHDAW